MLAQVGKNFQIYSTSPTKMTRLLLLHFYTSIFKTLNFIQMHDSLKLLRQHLVYFELTQNNVFILIRHMNANVFSTDFFGATECLKNVFLNRD